MKNDGGYQAIEIADGVFWVGAIDWELRNFHGYLTTHGSTYNAYLIIDEKVTLVDVVKRPFVDELMARISSVIDPSKIDVIISNHAEMDHSGCLPEVIQRTAPSTVYASKQGVKALDAQFHLSEEITIAEDGATLDLGKRTVTFLETRMCHWPDSMVSYLTPEKILFSQDAFGMHLATSKLFADENEQWQMDHELDKYYANILLPLSNFVRKTLDRIGELKLEFSMIAPDHGPIWRRDEDIQRIVGLYHRWSSQQRLAKAVLVYDTMWNSTPVMAGAIADGIKDEGCAVEQMPLAASHRSDIATAILDAGALVVGTPTMNGEMFPSVAGVLTYLKGLRPAGMIGAAFGSHGWSGEGAKKVAAWLTEMNVEQISEPLGIKYVPDEAALGECRRLGQLIGRTMTERFTPAD